MLSVRFSDNREAVKAVLARKVMAACVEAASVLAETYVEILGDTAPPHSRVGEIPHAYNGHKLGGYGPVNGILQANNTSLQGFNGTQITFLKNYIDHSRSERGAVVGFSPSHVTTREKNYLLGWDQGRIDGSPVPIRPWVNPGFELAKEKMKQFAAVEFRAAK
jgi:hypothetical protein